MKARDKRKYDKRMLRPRTLIERDNYVFVHFGQKDGKEIKQKLASIS